VRPLFFFAGTPRRPATTQLLPAFPALVLVTLPPLASRRLERSFSMYASPCSGSLLLPFVGLLAPYTARLTDLFVQSGDVLAQALQFPVESSLQPMC
jgi:hypothetical protein